jgi:membrane glycosyltransferase
MKTFKEYYKWIALLSITIALSVTIVFYFKRVFVDSDVLTTLSITQFISVIIAIIFSLLSIRYWQSIISFALSILVIYCIWNIQVGIH